MVNLTLQKGSYLRTLENLEDHVTWPHFPMRALVLIVAVLPATAWAPANARPSRRAVLRAEQDESSGGEDMIERLWSFFLGPKEDEPNVAVPMPAAVGVGGSSSSSQSPKIIGGQWICCLHTPSVAQHAPLQPQRLQKLPLTQRAPALGAVHQHLAEVRTRRCDCGCSCGPPRATPQD